MTDSFRARAACALRSPLLPIVAAIFLLPFGRASEAALLVCVLGAAIFFARAPQAWREHAGAKLLLSLWACYFCAGLISALDAASPARSWSTVAAFLRFAPFGFYVCFAVRREARLRTICLAVGVIVALWALDAWVQALTGWSLGGRADSLRVSGIFGADDLKLGPVLASLSPFLLWSARERLGQAGLIIALLFLLGPILLAGSRAAWLTYALVTIAFLWREARSPLRFVGWAGCALVIAALAVGIAWKTSPRFDARMDRTLLALNGSPQALDTAVSGRLGIWRTAWRMYVDHPVNGVGVRGFRYAYPAYANAGDRFLSAEACGAAEGACHSHQIVLEILDETGTIGLILWLAGLALALRGWRGVSASARERAFPVTVALAVTLFPLNTHFAFYSAWWGLLFWWLLSVWVAGLFVRADKKLLRPAARARVAIRE